MSQRESTPDRVREILDEQGCGAMGVLVADVIEAVAERRDTDAAYRALVSYDDAEHAAFVASA